MIAAFVLISAVPARIDSLGAEISDIDGVVEVHSVAGSDTALIAKLSVHTHEEIATAVTEHIARLEGITSTQTLIAFRRYGDKELDAMYEGLVD